MALDSLTEETKMNFYNTNHLEDNETIWEQGSLELLANGDNGDRSQDEILALEEDRHWEIS